MSLNSISEIVKGLLSKKAGLAVIGAGAIIYCGSIKLPIEYVRWVGGIFIAGIICQFVLDRGRNGK